MKAVEAVKEKFYCFLGIVHPTWLVAEWFVRKTKVLEKANLQESLSIVICRDAAFQNRVEYLPSSELVIRVAGSLTYLQQWKEYEWGVFFSFTDSVGAAHHITDTLSFKMSGTNTGYVKPPPKVIHHFWSSPLKNVNIDHLMQHCICVFDATLCFHPQQSLNPPTQSNTQASVHRQGNNGNQVLKKETMDISGF